MAKQKRPELQHVLVERKTEPGIYFVVMVEDVNAFSFTEVFNVIKNVGVVKPEFWDEKAQ